MSELISQEHIDILVDLALHTSGNRLLVFARKPAPVQVTHLAYCGTSGLKTMDYVITDSKLCPSEFDQYFTEQLFRLPICYWCYRQLPLSPVPGQLPAQSTGYITFGCMNNFGKVSPHTFDTWCHIFKSVPTSRLMLHSKVGAHRQAVRDKVEKNGVDSSRLEFIDFVPLNEYLKLYLPIDICLDPFPFAGGTTTCDALWMGVPVVSLAGQTPVSRGGLSILSNVGLPELVAWSTQEYVQIAANLAIDLPRLVLLRATMRERMKKSPLMDEKHKSPILKLRTELCG